MFYTKPWADVLIVLLVVVLFFGPKRLPQLGRSLGQGFREFKDGITGHHEAEEERPALQQAATEGSSAADQRPPVEAQQPPATSTPPQRESAEVGSSDPRP